MSSLTFTYSDQTVQGLALHFKVGALNLEPGFQRDSVWTTADRRRLIQSILQGYPIPSVFLYRRIDGGKLKYDVIDGKQRIESLLMFQGIKGFYRDTFSVTTRMRPEDPLEEWDWAKMRKKGHEHRVTAYAIQTVEVSGDLSDIIDLFVRINSTGKRLTGAEKRHARFYRSDFLKAAAKLANRYRSYFIGERILSKGQVSRMKHVELVAELMASISARSLINKKTTLDNIIAGQSFDARSLNRCVAEFTRTRNHLARMFPRLRTTRFANSADYYSLFMLVWGFDQSKLILNKRRANEQAQSILTRLTLGVDEVRQQLKKVQGARPDQRIFANYLLTVQGDTDSLANRKRREEILRQLLGGLFEKKDERRAFTSEQRRLIWHSDGPKRCASCKQPLNWNNFTIDHIKPFSKGGRTSVTNAALMCRRCNSRKGSRKGKGRPRG
jgi:hypothetical protein